MEMDQAYLYDSDSGNEYGNVSSEDDVGLEFDSDGEGYSRDNEEFQYEVLSTEDVTKHMQDCIKEFNSVVKV